MVLSIWHVGLVALIAAAAIGDVRSLRIPNALSLAVLGLFVLKAVISGVDTPIWWHLASFAVVFTVTAALFYAGLFGGGDTKLLSAVSIWFPLWALSDFIIGVALAGALFGLGAAAVTMIRMPSVGSFRERVRKSARTKVPYGPAILAGLCLALFH